MLQNLILTSLYQFRMAGKLKNLSNHPKPWLKRNSQSANKSYNVKNPQTFLIHEHSSLSR